MVGGSMKMEVGPGDVSWRRDIISEEDEVKRTTRTTRMKRRASK